MQHRPFGAFLVNEGFVTERQLQVALHHQRRLRSTRIGDVLVELGLISRRDLEQAFVAQMEALEHGNRQRLGEYLVDKRLISQDDLDRALYRHKRDHEKRIGEILVELGFLSEARLMEAVRAQLEQVCHA